jgi:hypothetical protein
MFVEKQVFYVKSQLLGEVSPPQRLYQIQISEKFNLNKSKSFLWEMKTYWIVYIIYVNISIPLPIY